MEMMNGWVVEKVECTQEFENVFNIPKTSSNAYQSGYPVYFREPHWKSMGLPKISRVTMTLQWRHNELDGISNHQPHDCLLNRLFTRRSKKTSKLRITGLCVGNSPETGEFPAPRASNAENVSIWWRHHDIYASRGHTDKLLAAVFRFHSSVHTLGHVWFKTKSFPYMQNKKLIQR